VQEKRPITREGKGPWTALFVSYTQEKGAAKTQKKKKSIRTHVLQNVRTTTLVGWAGEKSWGAKNNQKKVLGTQPFSMPGRQQRTELKTQKGGVGLS